MEDIEKELEQKSIERDTNVELQINEVDTLCEPQVVAHSAGEGEPSVDTKPQVKKTKKVRSQKQIEAFEKARIKRAEAIANRKKLKEEEKLKKKENKKQVTFTPQVLEGDALTNHSVGSNQGGAKAPVTSPEGAPPSGRDATRDQVVQNHYYYYGVPPPPTAHDEYTKTKKKRKSKRPPTPSSSESESSEEDTEPIQPQQYYEVPKPSYKFSYT